MSEENTFTQEQFEALQAENETFKQENEGFKTSTESMQAKMDQLLGETKKAKADKKEADDLAQAAANAKAQKDGDFEQLFNSSSEQAQGYKTELDTLRNQISSEKRNSEALKIAGQLADGSNAELLSDYVAQRLKVTDEGVKVLDSNGQLTVSTVEDLKNEFQGNARFASLLKGNQSSGGGAAGGEQSGGAANKVISRAEFDKMDSFAKVKHFKDGGKITD